MEMSQLPVREKLTLEEKRKGTVLTPPWKRIEGRTELGDSIHVLLI